MKEHVQQPTAPDPRVNTTRGWRIRHRTFHVESSVQGGRIFQGGPCASLQDTWHACIIVIFIYLGKMRLELLDLFVNSSATGTANGISALHTLFGIPDKFDIVFKCGMERAQVTERKVR